MVASVRDHLAPQPPGAYLLSLSGDPAVSRLREYDKSVHRDYHKMKAFVRFKRLQDSQEEQYVAWFEPEHYIVGLAAEFT